MRVDVCACGCVCAFVRACVRSCMRAHACVSMWIYIQSEHHQHHASLLKLSTKQVSVSGLGIYHQNNHSQSQIFSAYWRLLHLAGAVSAVCLMCSPGTYSSSAGGRLSRSWLGCSRRPNHAGSNKASGKPLGWDVAVLIGRLNAGELWFLFAPPGLGMCWQIRHTNIFTLYTWSYALLQNKLNLIRSSTFFLSLIFYNHT